MSTMSTPPRLQHFPVTFFAVIMGLSGLALAWRSASELFGITPLVSQLLAVLSLVLFCVLLVTYLLKVLRHPQAIKAEFNHPIKISFFPTLSISMVLMSILVLPIAKSLATLFFVAGAGLHLVFTLMIMGAWVHHERFQIQHMVPSWFIPIVGNLVVPIAGMPLGFTETSWFFFSIGIIFWLVLMTIFFNRIIFHDPLPPQLMPTFFILIAPPAIGFIAYLSLGHEIDTLARVLCSTALFFTLFLFSQIRRFVGLPFFLSWWAYSFPMAAVTIATTKMAERTHSAITQWIAGGLLVLTTVLIGLLLVKTLKAIKAKGICLPE